MIAISNLKHAVHEWNIAQAVRSCSVSLKQVILSHLEKSGMMWQNRYGMKWCEQIVQMNLETLANALLRRQEKGIAVVVRN